MLQPYALISFILGPPGKSEKLLACAVEITIEQIFERHILPDDLLVTKHVYPRVAKQFHMSHDSAARAIERAANRCWDKGSAPALEHIIGRQLSELPSPKNMILYLAYYARLETPYYEAILGKSGLSLP